MKSSIFISITIFSLLSFCSIYMSGAPIKVHAINIFSFFIAFVLATVAVEYRWFKLSKLQTWLAFSILGLVVFDVLSSLVIVKRELFMGWFIIYPVGIAGLVSLQILASFLCGKLPYKKINKDT
ncbi:hypothetical protein [Colwellia sp. RSH04]|uniref:hypothetical protein n=1 Tax=Colwellia sp. RSH04 TaxID=2305464 RepID=UPI000E5900B1|nr:hypothetical protein [Colwellia sp. RSH04]RHW74674.1 hypothetical protein D1094_17535 [Colwellia sp. RSH04]